MKVLVLIAATILGICAVLILLTTSVPAAQMSAVSASGTPLAPADTYFVAQTSLGTPSRGVCRRNIAKDSRHLARALKLQGGADSSWMTENRD